MINPFEKTILEKIDFVNRYHKVRNLFQDNKENKFRLKKNEILNILKNLGYNFNTKQNLYSFDIIEKDITFRLLLDTKGKSILAYIFLLKNGNFIDNDLSHFDYLLNFFDLEGLIFNNNFGLNSKKDFLIYIKEIINIFIDFKDEFLKSTL